MLYAGFALFICDQQSFPQPLADLSQHFAVVFCWPQQSFPQVVTISLSFMQDLPSLAQQDFASLPPQHACASFEPDAAILSQQEHFAFSAVRCSAAMSLALSGLRFAPTTQ